MELAISIIIAIASIFVISVSARYAIKAVMNYAKTTGISDYIIGFLVISIGTALPELSTAITGSFSGQGKLILGDIMGANILDVTVILGLTAILGKKIKIRGFGLEKTSLTVLMMVLLPLVLGLDGQFSNFDGTILIGAFVVYIIRLLKREKDFGYVKKEVAFRDIWGDMVIFLGCIVALLLSTRWLLIVSVSIATQLHIPFFIMGMFFIALGTTVPELTVSIRSVFSGASSIAFGELLGAVVANSTLVLGTAAILNPISFERGAFIIAALFMVTSVFIGILFLSKSEISWKEGICLLLIYLTFFVSQGVSVLW